MATTNSTTNYDLSQYIGSDVTSYLSNYNADMLKIDTQMKENADNAEQAIEDSATAITTANTAATSASEAVETANEAKNTADDALTAANNAQTNAGTALTKAEASLKASASNTIENLAPAYDSTLTYEVGDLVTYVDSEGSGKLYKCIVAVTTPMAFNINYWDDVTTSEVYSNKYLAIGTVSFDGTETYRDKLSELANALQPFDVNSQYILNQYNATYGYYWYNNSCSSDSISFSRITGISSYFRADILNVNVSPAYYGITVNNNGVTRESYLDSAPSAGNTIILYKKI